MSKNIDKILKRGIDAVESYSLDPLISIGLPVYNGEKYLKSALDSLLDQTYKKLELIISDNASTDNTADICQQYMRKDTRIRFYRNNKNIGASQNFQEVVNLARGEYFMWAAHDDLHDPTFIQECLKKLENDSKAGFAVCGVIFITEVGEKIDREYNLIGNETSLKERISQYIQRFGCYEIAYGLFRTSLIKGKRNLLEDVYFGSDFILGFDLMITSNFTVVNEKLFYYRWRDQPPKSPLDLIKIMLPENKKIKKEAAKAPYSYLAKKLLKTVDESFLENTNKADIKELIIDTIFFDVESWKRNILIEHEELLKNKIIDDQYAYSFVKQILESDRTASEILIQLDGINTQSRIRFDRPIYVWGNIEDSLKTCQLLKKAGKNVNGIIGPDPVANKEQVKEVKICYPSILQKPHQEKAFIIICNGIPHDIEKILLDGKFFRTEDYAIIDLSFPLIFIK